MSENHGIHIWGIPACQHHGRYPTTLHMHQRACCKSQENLSRAREARLKLNGQKCKFRVNQAAYIGHLLSSEGMKADPKRIQAIVDVPALQRFR